ncbi:unnamed protein product, partial [Hapterophycus canaliculatus]
ICEDDASGDGNGPNNKERPHSQQKTRRQRRDRIHASALSIGRIKSMFSCMVLAHEI